MRRAFSVLLMVLISQPAFVGFASLTVAAKSIQQSVSAVAPLTNQDVLNLVKAGLPPEIIITKLEKSGCACETSSAELQRLKTEGVSDEVLAAMINSTKLSRPRVETAIKSVEAISIPTGTSIDVESPFRVNSQEVKEGDAISFRVVNPIKIGGVTLIEAGATATGRITKANRGGHFGRAGRLAWNMNDVVAVDGSHVPIQFAGRRVGDSKAAKVATQMIITGVLLWPIAPVVLLHGFKRGENAFIPEGKRYQVVVSSEKPITVVVSR